MTDPDAEAGAGVVKVRQRVARWMSSPRKPLLDAAPRSKMLQSVWLFPYVCTAFLMAFLFGSDETSSNDVPLLGLFTIVAFLETVFLVVWLRRPIASGRREGSIWSWTLGGLAFGLLLMAGSAWVAR